MYRMNCVKAIARANISLTSLEDLKPWLDYYSKDGLTIGAPMELVRNFAKPVSTSLIHEMRGVLNCCYGEFSISLDGTPSFAEAECVILRIVTKKFQILELVVRLALFKNKLNSDELAEHVLQTIQVRLGLEISEWMSVQLDRASTNKAAIRKIKEVFDVADPSLNYCASHGMNNVGKNLQNLVN